MHILVIDGGHVEAEFRAKFGPGHEYRFLTVTPGRMDVNQAALLPLVEWADVAFDYSSGDGVWDKKGLAVFTEGSTNSIMESVCGGWEEEGLLQATIFGFCGLPTLLNRSLLEISLYNEADRDKLAETCAALGTDYRVVEDRVGLVTPRVICMIINEACYTLQEGTASIQDIDLGMKLGTGYPRGPFEWANAIGVERVYAVLESIWHDTHDERYKMCPLLKRQALRGQPFAL
jgi:3-hydroxybutyryl-CoA dehydrogenase